MRGSLFAAPIKDWFIFPLYIVAEEVCSGRLNTVLADVQADGVPIRAVYPSRRQLSPNVRRFIDMLAEA